MSLTSEDPEVLISFSISAELVFFIESFGIGFRCMLNDTLLGTGEEGVLVGFSLSKRSTWLTSKASKLSRILSLGCLQLFIALKDTRGKIGDGGTAAMESTVISDELFLLADSDLSLEPLRLMFPFDFLLADEILPVAVDPLLLCSSSSGL